MKANLPVLICLLDSRDLWGDVALTPKNQGCHYNCNAETYVQVAPRLG